MRPVVRGDRPVDDEGRPIEFTEYAAARGELIERLGQYCSYCETRLNTSLAVEHVRPKRRPGAMEDDPERTLDWDNFLLACTNCNSIKGNKDIEFDDYVWPDRDNTFRAFEYSVGGVVGAQGARGDCVEAKAQAMIALVGLDRTPNDERASDRRWLNRKEAWDIADRSKERITLNDSKELREQVVETALGQGFWSTWMTVFQGDADMLGRFLRSFPGTCQDCFDQSNCCLPAHRPGGVC